MEIQITEDVKEWIRSKGNKVTIKIIQVNCCCAPGIQELFTHLGKPKDLQNYHEFKEDDLAIFIQKQLSSIPT